VLRNLRSAVSRLTSTRLSETARQHLGRLLHEAMRQGEERLRARFRPVLSDAMHDVGLSAANAPEETAFLKTIEELLDRILTIGFFTYSDLRDAISRNNLKLPDLRDPRELVRGDPLLQLDRRLSTSLDGIYRPSEIYLRLMQRLTAPNFGTRFGRWITRFVTLPFGGALVILEALDLIFRDVYKIWDPEHYSPMFGPLTVLIDVLKQGNLRRETGLPLYEFHQLYAPVLWGLLGIFLMLLINSSRFRRKVCAAMVQLGRSIWWFVAELPASLIPWPVLRRLFKSWTFQILYSVCFLPILFCLALWGIFPGIFGDPINPWRVAGVFLIVEMIFNSRPGHAAGDAITRGGLRIFDWFRSGLLPGLFRLIIRLF